MINKIYFNGISAIPIAQNKECLLYTLALYVRQYCNNEKSKQGIDANTLHQILDTIDNKKDETKTLDLAYQ